VHVSARADYAMRALLQIARSYPGRVTMADIISAQALPRSYVEAILPELRRDDFVRLWRGGAASYSVARPPDQITVGSVLRALDGPFTRVRGLPPHEVTYCGVAQELSVLWAAASAALDELLDAVTLADVLAGDWSEVVTRLTAVPISPA
jgi:Rrf2 family protein